jgi:hypothetical protein
MPEAECLMADGTASGPAACGRRRRSSAARHFTLCVVLLTAACGRTPPALPSALPSAPPVDPVQQLRTAIVAATQRPGVQRGAWGIVVD